MNNKTLYTKDKSVKITFRCDSALSSWVADRSQTVGLTPSAFVRQILYQYFYGEKTLGAAIQKIANSMEAAGAETAVVNGANN